MNKPANNDMNIHVQGTVVLNEASFRSLPYGDPESPLRTIDEVVASDINTKGFKLRYSRRIFFSPSAFFEVLVVFCSDVSFEDNAGEKILKTQENIEEWVENNKVRIVDSFNFPAKASFIVSNLVVSAGFLPMVTPPKFLEN